jgi:precorrin-6A/cobalt-precorrin-6A reductase
VAKNSGGDAVAAKLEAARQLQIPVILLERPALPAADREFATVDAMLAAFQENGGFGEP